MSVPFIGFDYKYHNKKNLIDNVREAVKGPPRAPDPIPDVLEYYKDFWDKALHTGSRVICNPPVTGTDDDWVVLLKTFDGTDENIMVNLIQEEGFWIGGSIKSDKGSNDFISLKKDNLNLIITRLPKFYDDFEKATKLARKLNLVKKEDRVTLFKAIRDDIWPGDEPEEDRKPKYPYKRKEFPPQDQDFNLNPQARAPFAGLDILMDNPPMNAVEVVERHQAHVANEAGLHRLLG